MKNSSNNSGAGRSLPEGEDGIWGLCAAQKNPAIKSPSTEQGKAPSSVHGTAATAAQSDVN